ncbi:uncharacterized protein LOC112452791 [Temnothorax curvispinosus]|uniref:Uncharacterized protein LOC112452791 n=1 Tax=Temnothorax curvispinosus TaxID=300111 RepID=A0A6J1PHB6_9HYME|nr:uncharacterized protein LOC112452791 [Temnothorax curvispinosus]
MQSSGVRVREKLGGTSKVYDQEQHATNYVIRFSKSKYIYTFDVTEADAERVNNDLLFATYLLKKYVDSQTSEALENPIQISESCPNPVAKNIISANVASTVCDVDNVTNTTQASVQDDSQEKNSFRWPHEAILLLLTSYTDNEHHLKSGKTTHTKFWELVSSELIASGYNVTGMQCKSKMARLKNTYKNIKDHNAKSGSSRRAWRYLDIMDEMFTKKPWVEPLLTLDSGSSTIASSDEEKKDIGCGTRKSS